MESFLNDFQLVIRADDSVYKITDFKNDGMVISTTELHPGQHTKGHEHHNQEFIMILNGEVDMVIANQEKHMKPGDMMMIPGDHFHRAYNRTDKDIILLCIFLDKSGYEKGCKIGEKVKKQKKIARCSNSKGKSNKLTK